MNCQKKTLPHPQWSHVRHIICMIYCWLIMPRNLWVTLENCWMTILHFKVVLAAIFMKININNRKIRPYSQFYSLKTSKCVPLMIISHTIKFGSRKWRINVKNTCFLERSNIGHQMFFGVLSIMPCATAVNDFLGVLCATFGVSCSTKYLTIWTQNCPHFLV